MINKYYFNKGFTLIELLVVLAVIGILASVILASLNSSRRKGDDAAIAKQLLDARTQAGLYSDNNNFLYTNVCTAATGIAAQLQRASDFAKTGTVINTLATAQTSSTANCHENGANFAASIRLRNESNYLCLDSTNKIIKTSTALGINIDYCS